MPGETLQSGTHVARTDVKLMPDGTYEAQVFVRLTREPVIAETYSPAGIHPDERTALDAAQQRARRALDNHEF